MRIPKVITIDFETQAIQPRPHYPPVPVGVAIKYPGKKPRYYAWGHDAENNCSKDDGKAALLNCYRDADNAGFVLLFHNAKFDIDVAELHMGLTRLSWEKYHDTMYLLFLRDPHAPDFKLKPSSERILGMEPDEQDAVKDWLVAQKIVRATAKDWGASIAKAPGKLVGEYAKGDVVRTELLFKKVWLEIAARNMLPAYDTERQLMPILLDNERQGVKVDLLALTQDELTYRRAMEDVDNWLRKRLKVPELNVDSNDELAEALDAAGIVTEWIYTPTGKRSTSKENMGLVQFKDVTVGRALGYRQRLATCLGTFIQPMQATAQQTGGYVHTNWNQTRNSNGSAAKGTRTGRLSSSPNFQNIPKDFYDKGDGYQHPVFRGNFELPLLPEIRNYFLPDKGCVWTKRDYNQQELRLLAHFEDDLLCSAYTKDPRLDMHNFVRDKIQEIMRVEYERRKVKIVNFGILYGQGAASLAQAMACTVEEARSLRKAHSAALPGVASLEKQIKQMGRDGEPINTWGGREYFAEEPIMFNGRKITFEYKLLNYLIQGSAADMTKRSIIRYNEMKKEGRFMITVHDENNISVPKKALKEEMKILREAMENIEFGVPILSDGEVGKTWGALEKYEDK